MTRSSDKLLSLQIAGLQGFYWMIFCPIFSYASVYLLAKDYANSQIGLVMAVANILAIVMQPATGALIDRVRQISLKLALGVLALACVGMLAVIIWMNPGMLLLAALYVLVLALLLTMQPLVNALTFEYINAGRNVSFGVTRAMGSICFAVLSTVLGVWVAKTSTAILPVICLVLYVCFFLLVLTFKQVPVQSGTHEKHFNEAVTSTPSVGFLRRYERFIPFLIGIACLFIFHNVINTYLAQIMASIGGKNTDFGVSLTIAAICELPAFIGFSWLVARFDTRTLLRFSGFFYALRSFVFLVATAVWIVNVGQIFQGLSFAIFIPAAAYYINQIMREEDRVKGQTFITGFSTLGSLFGSVFGGWLLDNSSVHGMLIFGAVGAVLGCLLFFYAIRKPKPAVQPA